ncbi:diaminopimelate epimerase [soil metagenome]
MRFFKGHGLGNDYIALDLGDYPGNLSPGVVRLLCDRHRGIGSDGVLGRVSSRRAEFGLRIFNPDGTEAEKSGNGLRIFAAYLLDLGEVAINQQFSVDTAGGVVEMEVISDRGTELMVEVEMGIATFRTVDVGLAGPDRDGAGEWLEMAAGDRLTINTVSLGNPHCVVFMDELSADDLRRLGPEISTHPHFQQGTNVQFARVAGPSTMEAIVWERGAGETLASGSSACAVAAAAVKRGLVSGSPIEVVMPGGTLEVTVREDWGVLLRGPVEGVCRGDLTADHLTRLEELG